ncbi:MAG: hypothetical protein V2A79_18705 [Planctomycetota bacterium]
MRERLVQAAKALIQAALRGELTEVQARRLYAEGPEAVVLALLAASRRIAELRTLAHAVPCESTSTEVC